MTHDPARGYHPDDPRRPCYTCGSPATGTFGRDGRGGPSYSCGPHPSRTATPEELVAWAKVVHDWTLPSRRPR